MSRGEDVELRQRRGQVLERDFLTVAEIASRAGERRDFRRLREQADVIGDDARGAHAGPEGLHASGVALVAGEGKRAPILRRIFRGVWIVGGTPNPRGWKNGNVPPARRTCGTP